MSQTTHAAAMKRKSRDSGYRIIEMNGHTYKIGRNNFDAFGRPRNPNLLVKLEKMRLGREAKKRDQEKRDQ